MIHPSRLLATVAALAGFAASNCFAQVAVEDPWVRPTVATQKATGAFMKITAAKGGRLVGASSPVADTVEVHEMRLEGDTMKMRAVPALDLPAGKPVELRPGSYHVMLFGLKAPVNAGDNVLLNLLVEGADGKRETVAVQAIARPPK